MACLSYFAFFLTVVALVSSARAPASTISPSPVCMRTAPLSLLRETLPFCGAKVGSPTCCTLRDDANLHRAFLDGLKKHDYDHPPVQIHVEGVHLCSMTTAPLSLLRETLPFRGGKVGSPTCCTLHDDANLHRAFLDELKNHDYDHPLCRSTLKEFICAVCLPSAPTEPFSNTTASKNDESSLPLRCAAPSVSIHDLTSPSTEPPTPEWLLADDDNKASTTPKLLIGLIVSVLTLLGGFITYKIRKAKLECCNNNNQCCTNINCCLC